jgi:Flp pilus assembly protein TadG
MNQARAMTRIRSTVAGVVRCRRGAAASEFAIIGVLLFSLMIGIMEVGRYLMIVQALRTVTADAVRLAVLRASANLNAGNAACTNLSGNLSGANARVPVLKSEALSVTLSGCGTQAGITTVNVTATFPFTYSIPLLPTTSLQLRQTALAVVN